VKLISTPFLSKIIENIYFDARSRTRIFKAMEKVENTTHEEHIFIAFIKMSQDFLTLKLVSFLHHFN